LKMLAADVGLAGAIVVYPVAVWTFETLLE
jgi:hypothetical protein